MHFLPSFVVASIVILLPILLLCSADAAPAAPSDYSTSSLLSDPDDYCIVYFDYRNPAAHRLTVLSQKHAPRYTQWEKCARKCADFSPIGQAKRQWNHTCHPGTDELDCKITFNWGRLSAAGDCPALHNLRDQQQQQAQHNNAKEVGYNQIVKPADDVHVSGMCLLFADNKMVSGFRVVELSPPEWTLQAFGTCAQKCVKFGPNHGAWKITCNLPSGEQCQIRRANATFGMHGNCPVMRANGTFYFAQLFTNLVAEGQLSSAASTTPFSVTVSLILCHIIMLFMLGTMFGAH